MPINPLKIISSSNLVNTFCDLFRHLYMSPDWPVSHMKYCLVTSFIQVLCCLVLDSLPNMSHSALVNVCSKCVQVFKKLWNVKKKKKNFGTFKYIDRRWLVWKIITFLLKHKTIPDLVALFQKFQCSCNGVLLFKGH